MYNIHTSLGGELKLIKFANTTEEKVSLLELLKSLDRDTIGTLETCVTKKIKGVKYPIFEIVLGDLRLFYIQSKGDICILHIARKQKNKTELKDVKKAEMRAGSILKKIN